MNYEENKTGLVLGIVGIVCAGISFFVCWWLSIIAIVLGGIGLCFPLRTCSGISLGLGIVSLIANIVMLAVLGVF